MFAPTSPAVTESPDDRPRILSSDAAKDFAALLKIMYLPGFPERKKVPEFLHTFISPLNHGRVRDARIAYAETFEDLGPSRLLGESTLNGRTPHQNEVLNLFLQQNLTSELPMAHHTAA
jgi:hypothetical protein